MSNRQARIARKQRQRDGIEAYAHLKPTARVLPPVGLIAGDPAGRSRRERETHTNGREAKRRLRRYGIKPDQETGEQA